MNRIFLLIITICTVVLSQIPDTRIVAEWEPALGTMIRWPLGIPSDLVVELASDDILYVLVENNSQENQARNSFNNWGVNIDNLMFIYTSTYSHWTRDHGPQFLIGIDQWEVVNQQFDGYPVESGCDYENQDCDELMTLFDCVGTEFCNNQPGYIGQGYDCYVNNDLCQDFNNDGEIMDWLGDGYCDDGSWGLDFMCDQYSWDCGDCGGTVTDDNGYCDQSVMIGSRVQIEGRPLDTDFRGWEEDDDTNIDFANQLNWSVLDIPIYWTGGNFMTDGYGTGFSTKLMINENNMDENEFSNIVNNYLDMDEYHILDNPNEESIQHIDCLAKLVNSETIIIKQVSESSPEYECMEDFADSFYEMNTFYGRPFKIHRLYCPEINAGPWETNPVAAYTNSLILNNKVLVPQYGISEDGQALQTYQDAMPGYDVIGFDGAIGDPWYAEDALHCRTMGIFDPDMIHISHKSIRTEEIDSNGLISVEAEILDYSSSGMQSVLLHWKYSAEDGPFGQIELELESNNIYSGIFPVLNSDSLIEYFITATNLDGSTVSHPNAGWHLFNTLDFMLGDINQDSLVNIQDIILAINFVLNGEYDSLADLNLDGVIDILDIVQFVNMILN